MDDQNKNKDEKGNDLEKFCVELLDAAVPHQETAFTVHRPNEPARQETINQSLYARMPDGDDNEGPPRGRAAMVPTILAVEHGVALGKAARPTLIRTFWKGKRNTISRPWNWFESDWQSD